MEKSKQKLSLYQTLVAVLTCSIIFCAGFALGQKTISDNTPAVLGVQSPKTLSSLTASLLRLNLESNSVNPGLQLSPESSDHIIVPISTVVPTPEPTEAQDGMYWGGLNRNPNPTVAPVPTVSVAPTPAENVVNDNNKGKPTAVPTSAGYKSTVGNRGGPTATPTQFEKPIEESLGENGRKTGTISQDQLGKIIDTVGINLEKPEISRNGDNDGYKINGTLRDKLFGVFSLPYPVEIIINESTGEIENVSIPWWRTLFGNPFTGTVFKARCGDGICSTSVESFDNCKEDCSPVCGNGICEYGEGVDTCEADCTTGR
jgi:hypothetical protein